MTTQITVLIAAGALLSLPNAINATPLLPAQIKIRGEFIAYDKNLTSKFLLPFKIPRGYMMTGLHGTTFTTSRSDSMSETLFSLHVATSSACPSYGENMAQYKDVFSKYPQLGLGAVIVKQSNSDAQVNRVNFNLPIGVSLNSSCGYLIFDGSDFAGGPYKMGVNLSMSVSQKKPPVGMLRYSTQDEFILGDNNHDNAFKLTHILRDTKLYALFGNIAATTMPHSQYMPPKSSWKVMHQILIYRGGCPMFPNQDQDSNTAKLNQSIQNRPTLYSIVVSGIGSSAYYQPINKVFQQPIKLYRNDCLVHVVQSTTLNHTQTGAFNTEAQLFYETVDSSP